MFKLNDKVSGSIKWDHEIKCKLILVTLGKANVKNITSQSIGNSIIIVPFLASLIERIVSGTLVAAAAIIKATMEIGRLRPFKL